MILVILARLSALMALLIIVWASIVPGGMRPTIGASGVAEHMAAYAVFGLLLAGGFTRLRAATICIVLALLAGFLESFQQYVPGRNPQILDALMSTVGAGLGVLTVRAAQSVWHPRHK